MIIGIFRAALIVSDSSALVSLTICTEKFVSKSSMMNLFTSPALHILITSSLFLVSKQSKNGIGCKSVSHVGYKKGFRCKTHTDSFINITDIHDHLCTHRCITLHGCKLTNYNVEQRYCSLSNEICVDYIADDDFIVALFDSKEAFCLNWVSYTLYDDVNTIKATDCHPDPPQSTCLLGRLLSLPDYSLPGKFFEDDHALWSILDGTETTTGEKEILNIQDGCRVIWVPYTGGDTLPTGAIVGGYLARNGGTNLYIIRARINNLNLFGYYNPMEALGYVAHENVYSLTSMEMLVLV